MDIIKTVTKLAELIDKYGLTKIDIADDSFHYTLEKKPDVPAPVYTQAPQIPVPAAEVRAADLQKEIPAEVERENVQKSALVGTVYLAPAEGRDPYVTVGSKVKKGDTICIIESMKMLNEIPAERDGVITEILVKNEETVEYGQGLFVIDA